MFVICRPISELNNKMLLISNLCFSLSLSFSKKNHIFIRVAYFNHAENLFKYFDKLLKKKLKQTSDFKPFN